MNPEISCQSHIDAAECHVMPLRPSVWMPGARASQIQIQEPQQLWLHHTQLVNDDPSHGLYFEEQLREIAIVGVAICFVEGHGCIRMDCRPCVQSASTNKCSHGVLRCLELELHAVLPFQALFEEAPE